MGAFTNHQIAHLMRTAVELSAIMWGCLVLGCSKNRNAPSGSGTAEPPPVQQPVQPAVTNFSQDPEVQRRIEEAQRLSREKAERERGQTSPPNANKLHLDPQVWLVEFEKTRKDGRDRIGQVIDQMNKDILAVINKLPRSADELRSKMFDQYNNYVLSDYTAIPLYPELRQAGLKYVKERLRLDREYAAALRRLTAQKMPESGKSGVTLMLENELARSEKAIQQLELIEPLLVALPDKPIQVASQPKQPPLASKKPSQPTSTAKGAEPPISKNWKVSPDPGSALPTWPEKFPWIELRGIHPQLMFAPWGPSQFLIVGQGRGATQYGSTFDKLLIGDIRTGKPLGLVDTGTSRQSRPTESSAVGDRRFLLTANELRIAMFKAPFA